ncbi:hypothetical protein, partial [Salirhabdus euzebyi]|uniref:hypothetical protein n=1 Tax=Salirhabdus euzebyi TaxID=394506 RepID=UPI001C2D15AA
LKISTCLAKEIHVDSYGTAKTLRPHSERSVRVRRLSASPWKALCISVAAGIKVQWLRRIFYQMRKITTIFTSITFSKCSTSF